MSLETWYQHFPPSSRTDRWLFIMTGVLIIMGVMMVISSSSVIGLRIYHDTFYFVKRHILYMIAGLVPFTFGLTMPHQMWRKWVYPLWLVSLFLVLLTHIPGVGSMAGGAARWINIAGFRFQPSDVLKFSLVLMLAHHLDLHKDRLRDLKGVIVPIFGIIGVSILLVLTQPDLGTSIVLTFVSLGMLYVAQFPLFYFLAAFPVVVLGAVASILHNPYQLKRITAFMNPWADPLGKGFHAIQSLIAVGSGGLLGMGLGQSRQKFFYLPQQYTDYIFSILAEEFGFIATTLFLCGFFFFLYRGFLIAIRNESLYSKTLAVGLTLWIALQAIINIMVAINLLPSKGITLPFISFGGTSLIMVMFISGILLNISRYRRPMP